MQDATSGEKGNGSKAVNPKKTGKGGESEKSGAIAVVASRNPALSKVPLILALPSLGLAVNEKTSQDGHAQAPAGEGEPESAVQPQAVPAELAGTSPAAQLVPLPKLGNLAFSVQLLKADARPDSLPHQAPQPQQAVGPVPARAVPRIAPIQPIQTSAIAPALAHVSTQKESEPTEFLTRAPMPELLAVSALDSRETPLTAEPMFEPIHAAPQASVEDVRAILPDAPKITTGTEILLHLGDGKDQSSAAVRLVDRAGAVNISVHAADADLRSSLRSNLSELAQQMNGQGFKTEVVKPAIVAARADTAQDSKADSQRSFQQHQQQAAPGDRQAPRDRRANSGRWLEEFEEEVSGNAGRGGTN